jgi:hypothetical protein
MSIFPPVLINKDNIASMASIQQTAAAKWLVRNQLTNAAMPLNLNPQGIQTFNNVYQVANAAILNLFGTSDTATTAQVDVGFGKTPQALAMQQQRENTRDNADRYYMEAYLTSVMKKFVGLLCKKQTSATTIRMFDKEIAVLAKSYPEINEMYNSETGKLTIKPGKRNVMYDYEIVPGSTYAIDQKQQQANLAGLLQQFQEAQGPQGNMLVAQLEKDGYKFNFGELLKRVISSAGIQDWDKILTEQTPEEKDKKILEADAQQFQQALMQMNMNPNETPAGPTGQPQPQSGGGGGGPFPPQMPGPIPMQPAMGQPLRNV